MNEIERDYKEDKGGAYDFCRGGRYNPVNMDGPDAPDLPDWNGHHEYCPMSNLGNYSGKRTTSCFCKELRKADAEAEAEAGWEPGEYEKHTENVWTDRERS